MKFKFDYGAEIRRYRFPERLAAELVALFERHNFTPARRRATLNPLSFKTAYRRFTNICASIQDLRDECGHEIQSIYNLQERHIQVLYQHWNKNGDALGTVDNKVSYFRALAKWMGKTGMIKARREYLPDSETARRSTITTTDKTWTGNGVDVLDLIAGVSERDAIIGLQLELQCAFGMRVEESFLFRPMMALIEALERHSIRIEHGTKGGLARNVSVEEVVQLDVLSRAGWRAKGKNSTMIPSGYSLASWRNHYYHIVRSCGLRKDTANGGLGVTSHGLRHEYLNQLFERIVGKPSPVRGGTNYDPHLYELAMRMVVERAGHFDQYKAGAYLSTPRAMQRFVNLISTSKGEKHEQH